MVRKAGRSFARPPGGLGQGVDQSLLCVAGRVILLPSGSARGAPM